MAIPSQQIGWSQRAKLLWNISKQLENLIKVAGNVQVTPSPTTSTTTSTTTTIVPSTTTTTTTSVPLTTTANISGIQNPVCLGQGLNITVTFSGSSICESNTVYNSTGDFVGFTDIWLAVGGQSRLYVNVDNVSAVSSTSCVACPTTTSTTTLVPLDFTLTSSCLSAAPDNPTISTSSYAGSSTGFYYFSAAPTAQEQDALNNIFTGVQFSNASPNSYGQTGGYTVGQIYWVAIQDTGNPSNIMAKSVVMVACP